MIKFIKLSCIYLIDFLDEAALMEFLNEYTSMSQTATVQQGYKFLFQFSSPCRIAAIEDISL
jgi:hypothetical protein